MNSKLIFCFALVAFNFAASARIVRSWSDAELREASDLVVVARPVEVKDLNETNSLGWERSTMFQPRFRGVETTFAIRKVLKGRPLSDYIVLHSYRCVIEWGCPPDGPNLMTFTPSTNLYLLYLIKDGAGRYSPTAGQIDPRVSIKTSGRFHLAEPVGIDADKNLTKQISDVLTQCQTIKPGMTRADLLKIFAPSGGLSTAGHATFFYRKCAYIKVRVDFALSDPKQKTEEKCRADRIINISQPYLDWSIID